jgi:hypothetical protein
MPTSGSRVDLDDDDAIDNPQQQKASGWRAFLTFLRTIPGLPKTCRLFLLWSGTCITLVLCHSLLVFVSITTLRDRSWLSSGLQMLSCKHRSPARVRGPRARAWTAAHAHAWTAAHTSRCSMRAPDYGGTQALFATLAGYFSIRALRRENAIEIQAATFLVLSALAFDVSVTLSSVPALQRLLQTEDIISDRQAGSFVQNVVLGEWLRTSFTILLLFAWLPMTYYASKCARPRSRERAQLPHTLSVRARALACAACPQSARGLRMAHLQTVRHERRAQAHVRCTLCAACVARLRRGPLRTAVRCAAAAKHPRATHARSTHHHPPSTHHHPSSNTRCCAAVSSASTSRPSPSSTASRMHARRSSPSSGSPSTLDGCTALVARSRSNRAASGTRSRCSVPSYAHPHPGPAP